MRFILFCALIIGLNWAVYVYINRKQKAAKKNRFKAMFNIQL